MNGKQPKSRGQQLALLGWVVIRSLRMRCHANALTTLAVILGVALTLVVPLSASAFQRSAIDAANIFDLIVTAEGSQTQAVLNTIYYQEAPIGNIPYRVFASLKSDERSLRVIPMGFGDNFQGYPIVGTTQEFFELRPRRNAPQYFELAEGTAFSTGYQAVIGSRVAEVTELKLGDSFEAAHGVLPEIDPLFHSHNYRVVGILKPTGGPADRAVYTNIYSLWHIHGQHGSGDDHIDADHVCIHFEAGPISEAKAQASQDKPLDQLEGTHTRFDIELVDIAGGTGGYLSYSISRRGDYAFFSSTEVIVEIQSATGDSIKAERVFHADEVDDCPLVAGAFIFELEPGDYILKISGTDSLSVSIVVEPYVDHDHEESVIPLEFLADAPPPDGTDAREVTAILFAAHSLSDLYLMASQLNNIPGVQAVFPGFVLGRLIDLVGGGRQAYSMLGVIILILAMITVALNTYATALQAQRQLAILRTIGLSRQLVASSVLLEASLLSLSGILLGIVLAYAGTMLVGQMVSGQFSLGFRLPAVRASELATVFILLPVSLAFALLPAIQSARKSPLDSLS